MDNEQLVIVLEKHRKWLNNEEDGQRANLSRANLHGADLSEANLHGADLYGADLYGADLSEANLHGADLYGADLYGADLYGADLSVANLYGANLSRANLHGADLYGANLHGADLYGANLSYIKNINIYTFNSSRHFAYMANGLITIGCQTNSIEHWLENYKAIGQEASYSEQEIENYGNWIKLMRCVK